MAEENTWQDARDAHFKAAAVAADTLSELIAMARMDQAEIISLRHRLERAETCAARLKAELDGKGNPQ